MKLTKKKKLELNKKNKMNRQLRKNKKSFSKKLNAYFCGKSAILNDDNSSVKDKLTARIQLIDVFHKSCSHMKKDKNNG